MPLNRPFNLSIYLTTTCTFVSLVRSKIHHLLVYNSLYLVIIVCLSGLISSRIFLISGSNPMSSMRSASSRTFKKQRMTPSGLDFSARPLAQASVKTIGRVQITDHSITTISAPEYVIQNKRNFLLSTFK